MSRKTVATLGTSGYDELRNGYIGAVGGNLPHSVTQWEVTMLEILAVIMAAIIIILAVVYWGLVRWNRN